MAILDIPALLKPIPGDDPGGPHPSQVREKDPQRDPTALDKLRREAREKGDSLAITDPGRQKLWRDAMKLAQDLVSTRCKNLDWAISAVDTAVRAGGFAAAREGFQFLTQFTNDYWDTMWPRPNLAELESAEPEDRESLKQELEMVAAEARATRYAGMDDPGSGLLFPNVLREWVFAEQDGIAISVFNCRGSEGRSAKVSPEDVQAVARRIGLDEVRTVLAEIDAVMSDLDSLRAVVEEKFSTSSAADLAPSFREIRLALEECRQVADEMLLAVEGDSSPAAMDAPAADGSPATGVAIGSVDAKLTRAGLYKQLGQIADHLGRLEPHSPVPFLLRRVLELQDLPFPQLVREFTKASESVLTFMERSLSESPVQSE